TDEIAHLRGRDRRNTVDERTDLRELEIELRGLERGLRRLHRRLGDEVRLDIVIELTLRNRALLRERGVALDIALGSPELGLRFCKRSLHFGDRGLKRTRVDFEEHLSFAHECPVAIERADEISGHLR